MKKVKIGAILLAISAVLSRFLGMIRDAVFSRIFGIGLDGGIFNLDAYFAAFRIPDLVYSLLIAGALSAAFIPIFTKLTHSNKDKSFEFANSILNILFFALLVLSSLLFIAAPLLMKGIAPGFDSESLSLSVKLTRIMLLSPILLGLSSLFQGMENTYKRFLGLSLAPIVYNLSIIIAALFFGKEYGVFALAVGVVIGALLHFLVQIPGVFHTGYKYKFQLNFKMKELKEFFYLSLPRVFGLSATQLALLVDTIIASVLVAGSLSIYNYSLNLQALPFGVVAISFSVAIFSTLSENADNKSKFISLVRSSIHTISYWILPACFGIYLLRFELIDLILSGGSFDSYAVEQTALMMSIFIWAAIGKSYISFLARAFFSLNETLKPVKYSIISILFGITLSLSLVFGFGLPVWALAISGVTVASLQALFLFFGLAKHLDTKLNKLVPFNSLLKMLLLIIPMSLFVILVQNYFDYSILVLSLSGGLGALLYIGGLKLIGIGPSLRES